MKREVLTLFVTLTVLFVGIYVALAPKSSTQLTFCTQGVMCVSWIDGFQNFVVLPVKRESAITVGSVGTTERDRIGFWISEGVLTLTPPELLKGFLLSDEIVVGGVRYRRIWYREALR